DELSEQGERPEAAPIEACEHDGEQAEREVEREQLDRALVEVLRPGERQARPAHEGCERQRDGAELSRPRIATDQLPGKDERSGSTAPAAATTTPATAAAASTAVCPFGSR